MASSLRLMGLDAMVLTGNAWSVVIVSGDGEAPLMTDVSCRERFNFVRVGSQRTNSTGLVQYLNT